VSAVYWGDGDLLSGIVSRLAEIQVDATTGEVLADADTVQRITDHAERLAQRSPF
jgi:hypothetical protein